MARARRLHLHLIRHECVPSMSHMSQIWHVHGDCICPSRHCKCLHTHDVPGSPSLSHICLICPRYGTYTASAYTHTTYQVLPLCPIYVSYVPDMARTLQVHTHTRRTRFYLSLSLSLSLSLPPPLLSLALPLSLSQTHTHTYTTY
jgi:hypothetical protein